MDPLKKVVYIGAGIFVALFAFLWLYASYKTATFDPSDTQKQWAPRQAFAVVAGFLATSVATGTAAVLGIAIQQVKTQQRLAGAPDSAGRIAAARMTERSWLAAGCWTYLLVGLVVLLVYIFNDTEAPSMMSAFALSALGWLGGAFTAAFKAE